VTIEQATNRHPGYLFWDIFSPDKNQPGARSGDPAFYYKSKARTTSLQGTPRGPGLNSSPSMLKASEQQRQPVFPANFLSKFSAKYKLLFRWREYNVNTKTYLDEANHDIYQEQDYG
jgi:hypothetical protein